MIMHILLFFTCGLLGIFLGAQIAEAVLFVPYWKAMRADDFFELHKTYGKKIYQFFAPLTIAATIVPLTTSIYGLANVARLQFYWIVLGASTLIFFMTYFLYFKKANRSFADRSLSDEKLPRELIRWERWHWGRIIFQVIAFLTALTITIQW